MSDGVSRAPPATDQLLAQRQALTDQLAESPYDAILYLRRAEVHADLAYPDLAAGDAYRALLLTDELADDSFEYHTQAYEAMAEYVDMVPGVLLDVEDLVPDVDEEESKSEDVSDSDLAKCQRMARVAALRCYQVLAASLLQCGCLRSAHDFCQRGLAAAGVAERQLTQTLAAVDAEARRRLHALGRSDAYTPAELPDRGRVRRQVYPWNVHEPDRTSDASLAHLNTLLADAAPKCAVRVAELPVLTADGTPTGQTCRQLGLFATHDIAPGEAVLREYSLLTATNRLKDAACDACGSSLDAPPGEAPMAAVACDACADTVFCDAFCRDQALAAYHPAVCDTDVDAVAKDPANARDADDALYVLLLARLLAMAVHADTHPLDVDAVKYLWGDFGSTNNADATLPFSFEGNIATPLHILEKMDVDVFAGLADYDVWVLNTLYAKFRGTASARKSRRDGRPDVAAVHPLWCLANHDCDPNVTWEWGGRMLLSAKHERVRLHVDDDPRPGGIVAGQEILNHYCDIDLPVQQRREWASGSLGGHCMCQRCRTEAEAEATT